MKKILLLSLIASKLLIGAVFINPLSVQNKTIDNGGTLSAIDAYKDGIGAELMDKPGVATDNSAMNILVFKYGEAAKANNTTIADQVLNQTNIITPTNVDINLAQSLLHTNGSLCDDGNPSTHGETWLNDVCQGGIPNVYVNGTACDDGDPATNGETWLNDVCQGGTSNIYTNGTICDDGNSLTINDIYTNNICAGTLVTPANNTCIGGYNGDYATIILCNAKGLTSLNPGWLNLTAANAGITFDSNILTDISNLSNLRFVGVGFGLGRNKLTNLHGLENLEQVNGQLTLTGNLLTDISALSKLTSVNELVINGMDITNLHGLENLTTTSTITLNMNKLVNVDALSNIINISNRIDLRDNLLSSIYGLRNLKSINELILFNNTILNDISPLNSLTNVGVKVYFESRNYTGKLESTSYLCVNFSTKVGMVNSSGGTVAPVKSYICK